MQLAKASHLLGCNYNNNSSKNDLNKKLPDNNVSYNHKVIGLYYDSQPDKSAQQ